MAKTYDPRDTTIIIGGVYLTGLGEDMVEVEKEEDNYSVKVGAQGDVVRTKINNPLATITVTLLSTSPHVPYMDSLGNSGKLIPVSVIHAGETRETVTSAEAFIKKPATRTYGSEAEDREYEIQCLDIAFS